MTGFEFQPDFTVTPTAVALLSDLTMRYRKRLKFRIFTRPGGALDLRVHDKDYVGDWTLSTGDIGVAFSKDLLSRKVTLTLDCLQAEYELTGFGLCLSVGRHARVELAGDAIITRILSEEVEVCDAYGEYCYTVYR